jgi:hypothetical protein
MNESGTYVTFTERPARRCLPSRNCEQLGLFFRILFENSDGLLEALEFDRLLLGAIRELASFDAS